MIDPQLLELGDKLKNVVLEQKLNAHNAIEALPPGRTKEELKKLLSEGAAGKIQYLDAQKRLQKIISNAS